MVWGFSEEIDFVIGAVRFGYWFPGSGPILGRFEFLYYWFAGAIASNDFDLLLGIGEAFLADFYQVHPFLIAYDQIFKGQFTRFHLFDNFLEPIYCALEVQFRLARLGFAAHGENKS